MSQADQNLVRAEPATLAQLRELADSLDTDALTARARTLDVQPPDDRPGWAIVLEYGPDLTESALVWVGPDDEVAHCRRWANFANVGDSAAMCREMPEDHRVVRRVEIAVGEAGRQVLGGPGTSTSRSGCSSGGLGRMVGPD